MPVPPELFKMHFCTAVFIGEMTSLISCKLVNAMLSLQPILNVLRVGAFHRHIEPPKPQPGGNTDIAACSRNYICVIKLPLCCSVHTIVCLDMDVKNPTLGMGKECVVLHFLAKVPAVTTQVYLLSSFFFWVTCQKAKPGWYEHFFLSLKAMSTFVRFFFV